MVKPLVAGYSSSDDVELVGMGSALMIKKDFRSCEACTLHPPPPVMKPVDVEMMLATIDLLAQSNAFLLLNVVFPKAAPLIGIKLLKISGISYPLFGGIFAVLCHTCEHGVS
jgi:hypothetical protein